jgi:hypothetical protein
MQTLHRAAAALMYPAILCLGVACERSNPPTTSPPARAQQELIAQTDVPFDWSQLVDLPLLANTVVSLNDPAVAAEELPGLGHKFQLFFAMVDDEDPDNVTNDVISVTATATDIGIAFRDFPPGIKIAALDGQINLKYFFVAPRTCFGGSPRVSLLVDSDGDGQTNFQAHGHVNPPVFGACLTNQWRIEDLTDQLPRWEVTPATAVTPPCGPVGGPTTCTWDQLEARITTMFPNHQILGGFLLDGESCSFAPPTGPGCGKAYYDLFTLENRTLENDMDTVKK